MSDRVVARASDPRRGLSRDEARIEEDLAPLGEAARRAVIDMFVELLDGLYVHLPLKRAMYGIDPVQQLRRLHERTRLLDTEAFHREIGAILAGLRDAHTVYIAPTRFRAPLAALPFLVEHYGTEDGPHFIVSKVATDLVDDPEFVDGVEILEWNGVPIADAVRRRGEAERGGRADSAMARAIDNLTLRPLGLGPPPDEKWVIVGYRTGEAEPLREHRFEWRFVDPGPGPDAPRPTTPAATAAALHPDRAIIRRAKKLLFNTALWNAESDDLRAQAGVRVAAEGRMAGRFQDNVSAKPISVDGRDYGYLRLWSFNLSDDDGFVAEVVDMLGQLPPGGLIIDLRGNPGGLIWAAERLLQLFTPVTISPTRFSIIASDLTRSMTDAPQNRRELGPWRRTLIEAIGTGELYSQSVPITPFARCNDIGQVYGGPVVAIVDPTTYSAADLFAAGFADNGIGSVISVGRATGAGGANVWTADTLNSALTGTRVPLPQLPDGVGFTISVRRATRIGAADGAPIEDVGVVGHRTYAMTRRDLLEGNADLHAYCARLLASEPRTAMTATWADPLLTVAVDRLDRVDVHVDGRPRASVDIVDECTLELDHPREQIRVEGYQGVNLEQVRMIPIR